jgi:ABC-type glycerol-3-phosphate transport system substrate-binding protein
VPKKAVAIYFLLAFIGAALFVYFTFPRTKEEIPASNNQRPFPSAPMPSPNTPNGIPVPETVPHPNTPKVPPGPTLRVMAWASGADAQALEAEADSFTVATGRHASLTIDSDANSYRRDLQQAFASGSPPDVCLVEARDFSGLDPARDLADETPAPNVAPRSLAAFTVDGKIKAVPDEFSVDVLYYNPSHFDEAGLGYPDRHWNWDILEADARALDSLNLKNDAGQPIYPLELPADFDFWNILCTQAGHPALDLDVWHLSDADTKESQMRALDFIHEIFQGLSVTAPLPKAGEPPGRLFAQQRASLLIAPSELTASLPPFHYAFTLLPEDMARASLARVNGWAVTAPSTETDAARALAVYLARQPVHAGWSSVTKPKDDASPAAICYEALGQALVPRIEPKTAHMAHFLDEQINLLARNAQQKTGDLYARIQTEFQNANPTPAIEGGLPHAAGPKPPPKVEAAAQLRGL